MFKRLFLVLFCSIMIVASSGAARADTNEVQLLRQILQKLNDVSNGNEEFFYTVPLDNDTHFNYLADFISKGLFPRMGDPNNPYLGSILEDMRRIRPSLDSILALLQTASYTNDLSSVDTWLGHIDSLLFENLPYLEAIDSNTGETVSFLDTISGQFSNLDQYQYSYGLWGTHVDDNQWLNLESGIQSILESLAELGSETAQDYSDAMSDMLQNWDDTTAPTWLTRITSYLDQSSDTLSVIHSNDLFSIYTNLSLQTVMMSEDLVPTVKHIDEDFHSLLSYTTNSFVLPGMSETAGLTNAPSPAAQQREFDQYSSSATSAETQYSSDLSKYESGASYKLPTLDFSSMIPGEITPLRAFEPSFDTTPQLADNYSIPILSSDLHAGDVTISSFSLDLATGSAYDNVMRPFKEKIGPITEQIWNLIFAISVLLLAKYEWKAYMAGVGPSVAAHEQQEREDYDGYIF